MAQFSSVNLEGAVTKSHDLHLRVITLSPLFPLSPSYRRASFCGFVSCLGVWASVWDFRELRITMIRVSKHCSSSEFLVSAFPRPCLLFHLGFLSRCGCLCLCYATLCWCLCYVMLCLPKTVVAQAFYYLSSSDLFPLQLWILRNLFCVQRPWVPVAYANLHTMCVEFMAAQLSNIPWGSTVSLQIIYICFALFPQQPSALNFFECLLCLCLLLMAFYAYGSAD